MTKLSVVAPAFLMLSAIPAYAVTPTDIEPSRAEAPQAEPAPSAHAAASEREGGNVSAAVRDKELAELKAANAAQLETARQQIDGNTRSREEADRANAEYQKQMDAVNAAKTKYDADMVIYNKRVAACQAGDRKGCLGQ